MKRMLTQSPWDEKAGRLGCISSLTSSEEKLPEKRQWPGGQRRRDEKSNRIEKISTDAPESAIEPSLMGSLSSVAPEDRLRPLPEPEHKQRILCVTRWQIGRAHV